MIHEKGIEPDIIVSLSKEIRIQIAEQQEDILNLSEEERKKREAEKIIDPQIMRAHDILVARKIFLKNAEKGQEENTEKE